MRGVLPVERMGSWEGRLVVLFLFLFLFSFSFSFLFSFLFLFLFYSHVSLACLCLSSDWLTDCLAQPGRVSCSPAA